MKNKILLFLRCMSLFTACSEKVPAKSEVIIYHATDFHYLSQQLTENSPRFVDYIAAGDGKMTHYIDAITDAFFEEVIKNKPDYLVITGDLTFNGEKLSHIDFAKKLEKIEHAGVQVLVIPGNHDVDYPFSYAYNNDQMTITDRISKEEFGQIYKDFGLKQAYSKDSKTYSYLYKLTDKVILLALDTNTAGNGIIHDETIEWAAKELEKIKDGTTVITMTHQTLFDHFDGNMNSAKYSIYNREKLIDILKKYNVPFNLCGHIHTQHIFEDTDITDIATESVSVMPCNYGVVKCTSDNIEYFTKTVDIESWSKENGLQDKNLLDFKNYAVDFYIKNQSNLAIASLEDYTYTREEKQLLADFFAELNTYYFPGIIDDGYEYLISTDGYKKWCEKGEDVPHYKYIMSRMEEGKKGYDHNQRKRELK